MRCVAREACIVQINTRAGDPVSPRFFFFLVYKIECTVDAGSYSRILCGLSACLPVYDSVQSMQ